MTGTVDEICRVNCLEFHWTTHIQCMALRACQSERSWMCLWKIICTALLSWEYFHSLDREVFAAEPGVGAEVPKVEEGMEKWKKQMRQERSGKGGEKHWEHWRCSVQVVEFKPLPWLTTQFFRILGDQKWVSVFAPLFMGFLMAHGWPQYDWNAELKRPLVWHSVDPPMFFWLLSS